MEHEVFVPVPAQRLREALADPAKVARAVPGLQQDAGAEPVTGRLKMRVGSHSVTYRGTVRVTAREDGSYAAEGDVAETRGTGSVKLALTLRVEEADDGARLVFGGTAAADGRLMELPAEQVASAATRLLNRFAENLAQAGQPEKPAKPRPAGTGDSEPEATGGRKGTSGSEGIGDPDTHESASASESDARSGAARDSDDDSDAGSGAEADADSGSAEHASVFDTEVPPPSLDPLAEGSPAADVPAEVPADAPAEPPAEAAHARRTMIGRSAEEVDHAPPRGRYAPVPAPQSVSGGSPLRWAAPAAALALASAIVVGRALRKRR